MRAAKLTLGLALYVLLALPAATAGAQGVEVNDPEVNAWLGVAERQLGPATHCPSGVRVVVGDFMTNPGVWATVLQTTTNGTTVGECEIRLESDHYPRPATAGYGVWDQIMCTLIVHEYGHVLGRLHSADPADLMYPSPGALSAPACPRTDLPHYLPKEAAPEQAVWIEEQPVKRTPRTRCKRWRTKKHKIVSCRKGNRRWRSVYPRKR